MPRSANITRRGFRSRNYPVPAHVVERADQLAKDFWASASGSVLAELRPTAYIGQAHSSYTLQLVDAGGRLATEVHVINV